MRNTCKFLLLILVAYLLGCSVPEAREGKSTIRIKTIGNFTEEVHTVIGLTLLQALEEKHSVKTNFGSFLTCIDDVCSNKEYSWAIYVNNNKINAGVASYIIKDKDVVNIVYE